MGRCGMGQDGMGLGGLVRGDWGWMEDEDGVGQQVVSCRGRAGSYLCGQVLCSGCVVRCHECEGRDIQREAMGWAENVDGVLVGMGVQEVATSMPEQSNRSASGFRCLPRSIALGALAPE